MYFSFLQPGGDILAYSSTASPGTTIGKATLHRSEGISFKCIDEEDVVVCKKHQPHPKSAKSVRSASTAGTGNRSGTSSALSRVPENHIQTSAGSMKILGRDRCLPCVIVPLAASGRVKVGTLTADSFHVGQHLSEDSSRMIRFKRRWEPFMKSSDAEIMEVKVWRHPESRLPSAEDLQEAAAPPKKVHVERTPLEDPLKALKKGALTTSGLLPDKASDAPPSAVASPALKKLPKEVGAVMVRGTITEVSREKNGLPRKEGPVFSIQWDDGLFECDISLQDMQSIVKVDEKELGGHTFLTDDVPIFLESAGKVIGDGYDFIRKKQALEKLQKLTSDVAAVVPDVYQSTMQACVDNILMAKKIEIWEFVYEQEEKGGSDVATRRRESVFSVAKLDLQGNVKETRAPRYLRHLTDDSLKRFHDSVNGLESSLNAVRAPAFEMMDNGNVLVAPFFDVGFCVGESSDDGVRVGCRQGTKYAIVVTREKVCDWRGDLNFVDELAKEAGIAIECIRYREKRREERKQSLERVKQLCARWRRVLPINLIQWTLDELQNCLPKCDIYMSLLELGGEDAKYVATSKTSKMKGRVLSHNKGVTFQCLDSDKVVVFEEPRPNEEPRRLPEGTCVNVKYGKLFFPAKIVKFRGFEQYDVVYDANNRKETGVQRDRITVIWPEKCRVYNFPDNPKANGWPYICCAIAKGRTVVGFCGIDGFESQPKGRQDELQPEQGIVDYVQQASKYLGVALFEHRMTSSLEAFSQLTRDFDVNPASIIRTCVSTITECILYASNIDIFEVHPRLTDEQRNFRRSLRRSVRMSRHERLSAESNDDRAAGRHGISKSMAIAAALEAKAAQARINAGSKPGARHDAAASCEEDDNRSRIRKKADVRRRAHWGGSVLVESSFKDGQRLEWGEAYPAVVEAVATNFSQPSAQALADKPEFIVAKFRDIDFAKNTSDDAIDEMPYYCIVVERKLHALWPEDELFLGRLAHIAQQTFDCVRGREHRRSSRKVAISNIRGICAKWKTSPVTDIVQNSIVEMTVPLKGTDIYAALLEPGGHVMNYVGASEESCMKGKRLKRGRGISFSAIDSGKIVLVRGESMAKAMNVHMFIDIRTQGWPYVCLPLNRGKLARGILAVDSFDSAGKGRQDEEHPEKGVPDFLKAACEQIGTSIDKKMKLEALANLASVTRDPNCTIQRVFQQAINCLQENITFAQEVNVLEISNGYPLPFGKSAGQGQIDVSGGGAVTFKIVEAKDLAKVREKALL